MPTESGTPAITTRQMIEVDRLMIEDYGIGLIQMMENAGRSLADLARRILGGDAGGKHVVVFCGGGNNGGGGLVATRHLHNWGAEVLYTVVAHPNRLKETPAHQVRILEAMGLKNDSITNLEGVDLVIDALIGYGLTGDPKGQVAAWIKRIAASNRPVLALDVPSGLDATSGIPGNPCIRATATLTLALPKVGLLTPEARPYVGELYLADISVPPELYRRLGIEVPAMFSGDAILRILSGRR